MEFKLRPSLLFQHKVMVHGGVQRLRAGKQLKELAGSALLPVLEGGRARRCDSVAGFPEAHLLIGGAVEAKLRCVLSFCLDG